MTINQKYQELKARCGRFDVIFKDVGIPNGQGGWLREPRMDPDHGGQIPTLRVFSVIGNEGQRRQRMGDIMAQGWAPFEPEPVPESIRPAAKFQESEPEDEPKTGRRSRSKSK